MPTPMTHAEIVDVLLTAKVRCSTFPMSGLTAAERDAEHARIDRAIATLREEPKAAIPSCKHTNVRWSRKVGVWSECAYCHAPVRCRVAHAKDDYDCRLNNLQCSFPECIEAP